MYYAAEAAAAAAAAAVAVNDVINFNSESYTDFKSN